MDGHDANQWRLSKHAAYNWRAGVILCPNPLNKPPASLSLHIPGKIMADHRVPVTNIHEGRGTQQNMAVCISTLFGLNASDKGFILQSLDMKKAMGADTVFIYTSNANDPAIEYLLQRLNGSFVPVS